MPHRAGYFVLAYAWDHHCQVLFESMEKKLQQVEREVSELERDLSGETEGLLNYYKKWRSNNELYRLVMAEVKSRQFVINSLGYRGYGVNRDLLSALDFLVDRYGGLEDALTGRFYRHAKAVEERLCQTLEVAGADRVIIRAGPEVG